MSRKVSMHVQKTEKDFGKIKRICFGFIHSDVMIDWSSPRFGTCVSQYFCNETKETKIDIVNDFETQFEVFFEVASGYDYKMMSSKTIEYEDRHYHHDGSTPRASSRVVYFNDNDQTTVALSLLDLSQKDRIKFEQVVRNWRRVIRASSNSEYYVEDSMIVICSAIEGVCRVLLNKRTSKAVSEKEVEDSLLGHPKAKLLASVYKDARNSIAHGRMNDLFDNKQIMAETAQDLFRIFLYISCCRIFSLSPSAINFRTRFVFGTLGAV